MRTRPSSPTAQWEKECHSSSRADGFHATTGRPAGAHTAWTLSVYFTINTLLFSIFILKYFKHKRKYVSMCFMKI